MNYHYYCKLFFCLFICSYFASSVGDDDLYSVLGVSKKASAADIKRAYKNLAREWHPDKNSDPSANEKFMKINEAYETLGDGERRAQYDRFGTTSAQNAAGGGGYGDMPFQGATFMFNGFPFNFGRGQTNDKYRITLRLYENNILQESHAKPYLIYIYTDFCFQCRMLDPVWEQTEQDLEKIGMGIGTFNPQLDSALGRKLRVSSVPAFVSVVCGKLHWFNGIPNSVSQLRDFMRAQYPDDLIVQVDNGNINEFLGGWKDNKVRMLMFDTRKQPCLRYVVAAFAHRDRVLAGYINMAKISDDKILRKYRITRTQENLLIFNEYNESPVASIAMPSISRSTMDEVIEAHKYLKLPRLSSQSMFNYLCPVSSPQREKKLCAVLLSRNVPEHDIFRDSFREFASQHEEKLDRIKFAYVFEDTQSPFTKSVTWGRGIANNTLGTLKVVVVWRRDRLKIQFDVLEDGWYASGPEIQQSGQRLLQLIDTRLASSQTLSYAVELPQEFIDEHAKPLLKRILRRLNDWFDWGFEKIVSIDETAMVTLFTTACVMVVVGLLMKSLFNAEQQQVASALNRPRSNNRQSGVYPPRPSNGGAAAAAASERPSVTLVPLCTENYQQLIPSGPPGVRMVVLLVDEPSKNVLLRYYAAFILPHTRSKEFQFGFLQLEQYLGWYRSVLELTIDFHRPVENINMKNCVGTVLAINGPRQYYSIYHAGTERTSVRAGISKTSSTSGYSSSEGLRNRRGGGSSASGSNSSTGGKFLGMEESDSEGEHESSGDASKLFESELLRGLGIWLDKLSSGSQHRFRVREWPPMVVEDNRNDHTTD